MVFSSGYLLIFWYTTLVYQIEHIASASREKSPKITRFLGLSSRLAEMWDARGRDRG